MLRAKLACINYMGVSMNEKEKGVKMALGVLHNKLCRSCLAEDYCEKCPLLDVALATKSTTDCRILKALDGYFALCPR